jgi:hypothetical protein
MSKDLGYFSDYSQRGLKKASGTNKSKSSEKAVAATCKRLQQATAKMLKK